MIRSQRTAHVRLWLFVLPIAIGALALALLTRTPRPVQDDNAPGAPAATGNRP